MITPGNARIGIVGAGAIANAYAQAFEHTESAKLVAVADVRREAAEAMAESAQCKSYRSHHEMAASVPLDGVIVCTPPATHPEICIDLLGQGVHVLCEKPLAIGSVAAARMIRASQAADRILTMASKFRFVEDVAQARSLVASGVIGEPVLFENSFTAHVDMTHRWNSQPEISGGGVLIDNGTHSVDLMRYFLGPLAQLQVVEGKRIQGLTVEDTVRMFLRSEDGVMGSVDLSWSINKELPNYISIYGSAGTLVIGWKESKYRRSQDENWISFGGGYNKVDAFRNQIENFAGAIRGTEPLRVTPEDALASVHVIETAYSAMRESAWRQVTAGAPVGDEATAESTRPN